jgi:hypothetical protein
MFELKIRTPVDLLICAAAIGILLFLLRKSISDILIFLENVITIFINEFNPKSSHRAIEKINCLLVIAFVIITLLCFLFELAPSAVSQTIGSTSSENKNPVTTIICLLALVIIGIVSPIFIMIDKKDREVRERIQKL